MELYAPWVVYENLHKMLKYRHAVSAEPPMSESALAAAMNNSEYTIIKARRQARPDHGVAESDLWIYLIAPGSTFATKTAEFRRLTAIAKPEGGRPLELMFVSALPFKPQLMKEVGVTKYYTEAHSYDKFLLEAPAHEMVPKHEIASLTELNDHFEMYGGDPKIFQWIKVTDVQAVWIGLKLGQVCKITRMSELAGTAIAYRLCI